MQYVFEQTRNEDYFHKVIRLLEMLLITYLLIFFKDSVVNALCYGANLTVPGVLRYENGKEVEISIGM